MIGALFPLAKPILHGLDPEAAHDLTIRGLSLLPPDDMMGHFTLRVPGETVDGHLCCAECGKLRQAAEVTPGQPCDNCGNLRWTKARLLDAGELPQLD